MLPSSTGHFYWQIDTNVQHGDISPTELFFKIGTDLCFKNENIVRELYRLRNYALLLIYN